MPQPPSYIRQANFVQEQAANPTGKTPGVSLDAEYNAIKATLDQTLANLKLIQRDDGVLANNSVGPQQLQFEVLTGITLPWVTGKAYKVNDTVWQSNVIYVCLTAHTSGVFATDLAANLWISYINYAAPLAQATASATAAANSATAALASQNAAAASATAAASSQTAAAASAQQSADYYNNLISAIGDNTSKAPLFGAL